jgi:hypothetical protein
MPLDPILLAMAVLVSPAPQANTIWARCTIECGSEREMAMPWRCRDSPSLRISCGIGRPSATEIQEETTYFTSYLRDYVLVGISKKLPKTRCCKPDQ